MSMEEWKEYKLRDFMQFNPKERISKGQVARKIAMDQLVPYCRDVSSNIYEEYKGGSKFKNGDTIMARITPCLENGKTSYISSLEPNEIAFGSTEYIVLRNIQGVSDSRFVYYLSICPQIREVAIKSMVGSSGRQRVQQDVLENYCMNLPSLPIQQKIANILSFLDDKIELNRLINDNLEQQAQALYKQWFVDFEFPNEEGNPYKSSGGKMVDSEQGTIPDEWSIGRLEDVGDIIGGGTPSKAVLDYYTKDGIAWITPKDLSITQTKFTSKGEIDITELGYSNSSAKIMPRGSVLFSSRAPIGYISIAKNEVCTNQGFKSVVPHNGHTAFIYYFLLTNTSNIESQASGSTFKEASGALMKALNIVIPNDSILDAFEKIISPIFDAQENLEEENLKLATLRDSLLPKLMSGELSADDVSTDLVC